MEKLRSETNDSSNKSGKQLLSVCDDLSYKIPGCKELHDEFSEFWSPGYNDEWDDELEAHILAAIRRSVVITIKETQDNISEHIEKLHPATKLFLEKKLPINYRYLFHTEKSYVTLPSDLIAPNCFFAINRNEGSFPMISKKIIRAYGPNTKVELSGNMMLAFDGLILALLFELKRSKQNIITEKNITFTTSLIEITKMMGQKNPYLVRAVFNSLQRLSGVNVSIHKKGEYYYMGHILDGMGMGLAKLEKQNGNLLGNDELKIYMDQHFIELEEPYSTYLDLETMKQLKSKARAMCLYMFLSRQQDFRGGKSIEFSIPKLYNYAGLRPEGKPNWRIVQELKDALVELQHSEIVKCKIDKKRNVVTIKKFNIKDTINERVKSTINERVDDNKNSVNITFNTINERV
jgi:hypothetical protein